MELVLVTPTNPPQIVRGLWKALRRTFLFPAILVVGLKTAGGLVWLLEIQKTMAGASANPGFNLIQYQSVSLAAGTVNFVADLLAVGWFGMWMGLTTKKTTMAVVKTLAIVVVLPWLAWMFLQGFLMGLLAFTLGPGGVYGNVFFSLGPAVIALVNLGKDIFFIAWSRRRLLTRLRETITGDGLVVVARQLPQLPCATRPPPIARATMS